MDLEGVDDGKYVVKLQNLDCHSSPENCHYTDIDKPSYPDIHIPLSYDWFKCIHIEMESWCNIRNSKAMTTSSYELKVIRVNLLIIRATLNNFGNGIPYLGIVELAKSWWE